LTPGREPGRECFGVFFANGKTDFHNFEEKRSCRGKQILAAQFI
jgi:hypothetical protein